MHSIIYNPPANNKDTMHSRRTIKTVISVAMCAAACTLSSAFAAAQGAQPAAAPVAAKPAVLAGDDFFAHVNGDWLAKTEIPSDRASWGAGAMLAEDTNTRLVELIEAIRGDRKAGAEARKIAAFYQAFMDEAAIEAKGATPLKPLLAKIDAISDKAALTQALGASLRADVDPLNNTNFFTENRFGVWIAQGFDDPAHNTAYLLQGGLGMPERAYYLTDSVKMAELRSQYRQHIKAMLALAGYANAEARAAKVFALETAIATSHATRDASADVLKANNHWRLKDFGANAPGIDWPAFFNSAKLGKQDKFIVWHPGAVKGAAALVAGTDLATWKDFLAFHQINHVAPNLSKAFVDQYFALWHGIVGHARAVAALEACSGGNQRRARHAGRPFQPGRRVRRLPRLPRRVGRQGSAGQRRPAVFHRLCAKLAHQAARGGAAPRRADRQPRAGVVPHRDGAQHRRLVPRIRRAAGPGAVPATGRARAGMVKRMVRPVSPHGSCGAAPSLFPTCAP